MAKRQIKITISPTGDIQVDNAGNPDEQRILDELSELAEFLTGDPEGFQVEQHVHTHGHEHAVDHQHTGS